VVYRRKTFSSDFRQLFYRPMFFHQESSSDIETNGSQTVQGPSYTVDASKLLNQAPSIFGASSKMCLALS